MTEEKKGKTRIDFTLMDYNPKDFSYNKGTRKQSFFLENLKNMDFQKNKGYFSIKTSSGWVSVVENPWEILERWKETLSANAKE